MRDFLHHLITEQRVSFSTCNQKVCGIRFLYRHVLGRTNFALRVPAKRSGRLPEPLARTQIARLFDGATSLKQRMVLMTAYGGGGFRASEWVHLLPTDILSERMMMRIDQGKGRKDRYTLLSHRLLDELRAYWRAYRPRRWLFEATTPGRHLTPDGAWRMFNRAKAQAGIRHGHGIHCLRHSFATHLMEAGCPSLSSSA